MIILVGYDMIFVHLLIDIPYKFKLERIDPVLINLNNWKLADLLLKKSVLVTLYQKTELKIFTSKQLKRSIETKSMSLLYLFLSHLI